MCSVENRNYSEVCSTCRDDNYSLCSICGDYHPDDDCGRTNLNRTICSSCQESGEWYCWENGRWHRGPEESECCDDDDSDNDLTPDQGPCERNMKMWKWFDAHLESKVGRMKHVTPAGIVSGQTVDDLREFLANIHTTNKCPIPAGFPVHPSLDDYVRQHTLGRDQADSERDYDAAVASYEEALSDYRETMSDKFRSAANKCLQDMHDGHIDTHAGGIEWLTKQGTLPKRISKWYHKTHKISLPGSVLEKIGNICRVQCATKSEYYFDIVTGSFQWSRGTYGDDGSCYWGGNKQAKDQLETQHNAFAVRFYDDMSYSPGGHPVWNGNGMGRCWVLVQDCRAYIFNVYDKNDDTATGRLSSQIIGRILSEAIGGTCSYRICDLSNNAKGGGMLYINGDRGVCIGFDRSTQLPAAHDFNIRFPE